MESIFLLLPISLVLVLLIGAAFWWAVFAGQFDDTNRAAKSIILDNDDPLEDDNGPGAKTDASARELAVEEKDEASAADPVGRKTKRR